MGFVLWGFSLLFFKVFFHVMHLMLENCLLLWNPISNQLRNLNFTNNFPGLKLINSQLITVKIVSPKAPFHFSLSDFSSQCSAAPCSHPAHGSGPSLSLSSSQGPLKLFRNSPLFSLQQSITKPAGAPALSLFSHLGSLGTHSFRKWYF